MLFQPRPMIEPGNINPNRVLKWHNFPDRLRSATLCVRGMFLTELFVCSVLMLGCHQLETPASPPVAMDSSNRAASRDATTLPMAPKPAPGQSSDKADMGQLSRVPSLDAQAGDAHVDASRRTDAQPVDMAIEDASITDAAGDVGTPDDELDSMVVLDERRYTVAVISDLNGSYGSTRYGSHVRGAIQWLIDELSRGSSYRPETWWPDKGTALITELCGMPFILRSPSRSRPLGFLLLPPPAIMMHQPIIHIVTNELNMYGNGKIDGPMS